MSTTPTPTRSRRGAVVARLRNLPGRQEWRDFARAVASPVRASALRATWDGLLVAIVLRRRGVRSLVTATDGHRAVDGARAVEVATAVDAGLGVLPFAPTCLRRSLVLLRELRRLGLAGTLQVGVRQRDGRTEAHAWVDVAGAAVNDDPDLIATYRPFPVGEVERLLPMLP